MELIYEVRFERRVADTGYREQVRSLFVGLSFSFTTRNELKTTFLELYLPSRHIFSLNTRSKIIRHVYENWVNTPSIVFSLKGSFVKRAPSSVEVPLLCISDHQQTRTEDRIERRKKRSRGTRMVAFWYRSAHNRNHITGGERGGGGNEGPSIPSGASSSRILINNYVKATESWRQCRAFRQIMIM